MKDIKLKPCPFCGGKAVFKSNVIGFTIVRCSKCHAIVPVVGSDKKEECCTAWNRRADLQCTKS